MPTVDAPIHRSFGATGNGSKSRNPIFNLEQRLSEKGWVKVEHPYIKKKCGITVFNRSRGAESNYFVIARRRWTGATEVLFTNPTERVDDREVVISRKLTASNASEVESKICELAARKPTSVYWFNPHTHMGWINSELIWDDGISKDYNVIAQALKWNRDFVALTSHNWTHDEKRLGHLKEVCDAYGIVFVPGWENTTTVEHNIMSPHLLVYCADIETAMRAKYEFLSKKLENKKRAIPILCGAPGPFDVHIEYITKLHNERRTAIVVAHPFSTFPGIDLFDPNIIAALGYERVWSILNFVDGVEMYNGSEAHCELDFDLTDRKRDFRSDVADDLRQRLTEKGLSPFLSAPMLNYLIGLWAKENRKATLYGHDDHYVPEIDEKVGAYGQGHTKYIIGEKAVQRLKSEGRKPTSAEFVSSMIEGIFPGTDEEVAIEAFAYARMTKKGPQIVDARRQPLLEKFLEKIRVAPEYYGKIVSLQLKYWFADKEQKEEIAKELEKAKCYQSKKSQH